MNGFADAEPVVDSRIFRTLMVIQADALDWVQWAVPDDHFDCIFADWPFNCQDGREDYYAFAEELIHELYRILRPGCNAAFVNNPANTLRTFRFIEDAGFTLRNEVVIQRPGGFSPAWQLPFTHNTLLLLAKGSKKEKWNGPRENNAGWTGMTDVIGFQNGTRYAGTWHPQAVPVKFTKDVIELISNRGDVVYDPFSGSGTTLAACHELGRKCVTTEVNREYFLQSCARLDEAAQEQLFDE